MPSVTQGKGNDSFVNTQETRHRCSAYFYSHAPLVTRARPALLIPQSVLLNTSYLHLMPPYLHYLIPPYPSHHLQTQESLQTASHGRLANPLFGARTHTHSHSHPPPHDLLQLVHTSYLPYPSHQLNAGSSTYGLPWPPCESFILVLGKLGSGVGAAWKSSHACACLRVCVSACLRVCVF